MKKKEEKSSGKGKEVDMGLCHTIRDRVASKILRIFFMVASVTDLLIGQEPVSIVYYNRPGSSIKALIPN